MSDCFITRRGGFRPPAKIYGVKIDTTNSNPETAVTYTDDAVGMTPGSALWDQTDIFKDIRPCTFKQGVPIYYLNPNDFTQKDTGGEADITSGRDGDVMIEIPKMAYKIGKEGNYITVQVTRAAKAPEGFHYYAFSRNTEGDRDKLYIGAYLGSLDYNSSVTRAGDPTITLHSLSGKTPNSDYSVSTYRSYVRGGGYDLVSFYPMTLLQCLYLIRYKNLDSQSALGYGNVSDLHGVSSGLVFSTGRANQNGMYYGDDHLYDKPMKFAGIEDLWGNVRWYVDGMRYTTGGQYETAFTGFSNSAAYKPVASYMFGPTTRAAEVSLPAYFTKIFGTTETGFIADVKNSGGGTATTYFCDYAVADATDAFAYGGDCNSKWEAGIFSYLKVAKAAARLMYL